MHPCTTPDTEATDPVVSVVVPAYNASRWIGPTLASVCSQTLRSIEVIVVDDGSTDRTAEIVAELALIDSRVRLIRRANTGVGAARNAGIRAARGEYIAPLDADDIWDTNKLEEQVRYIEWRGEKTGMVYCWSRRIDENGAYAGPCELVSVEGDTRIAIILRNFIFGASVPLYRTKILKQVGLYLTREEQGGAQGCEDWDLSIRIAEKWAVGVVRKKLVSYRQTDSCMSSNTADMAASFQVVMRHARERNPDLPPRLFRWAKSHFECYLASKSYRRGDYRASLPAAVRAVAADPLMILVNRRLQLILLKALLSLAIGRTRPPTKRHVVSRSLRPERKPLLHSKILAWVHSRRWSWIREQQLL